MVLEEISNISKSLLLLWDWSLIGEDFFLFCNIPNQDIFCSLNYTRL